MSYCRFSTDDYQCDVYVYADCSGGFTTHVAGNRVIYKSALPPPVDFSKDATAWFERHRKVSEMLEQADRVDIGLPHDGQTFNDDTAKECAERLSELKGMGYMIPQAVIDALNAEEEQ